MSMQNFLNLLESFPFISENLTSTLSLRAVGALQSPGGRCRLQTPLHARCLFVLLWIHLTFLTMEEKAAHWEKVNRLNFPASSDSLCSSDGSEAPLTRLSKSVWELCVRFCLDPRVVHLSREAKRSPTTRDWVRVTTRVSPVLHDVSLLSPEKPII